jgi:recombination protein RecR
MTPDPLNRLVAQLAKLPGIGEKTAQRLAFHILRAPAEYATELAQALREVKEKVHLCTRCFSLTDTELCGFCRDTRRDESPLEGVGPDQLRIKELLERLGDGKVEEVIVATNPDVEGEATALYLNRLLKPLGLRISRIAQGLPMGGDLEYADQATLAKALSARREL